MTFQHYILLKSRTKCVSAGSIKSLNGSFFGIRYTEKFYFRAKCGAKDIQKGRPLLICSYQFAPFCRRRMPQCAAAHL